ncbi:abnormal spindle-like microcephaly-associated protein [Lepisosteus oculatus]|uniref:abnormal spindle-like microcephaly-associated protein n=1 Tax=Lepisosteus oculatus TaxID=7918 RepID=UPI00371E54B6
MSAFVKKGVLLDFSPTCSVHNEINPGKGAAVTNFSSGDANKENKSGSYPVLSLVQFSRAPFVSFETVKLGSSKGSVLVVENPNQDVAEVKIDKFPSAKGFSVDHRHFILKPEESTSLSITWTPVEEGGVRELITFIANGIVKHQAILLGRAEAPKKKRKSLWDSIKTKRPSECPVPAKGRKTDSSLKKSANKTFHVSRKVQYVKEKGRSPLSSYSNAPIVGSTLMSNPAESRSGLSEKESYYTPGSLQKSKTRSALDKSKSNDSFLDDKSVPLPRPTFLVSDFDHVERSDHIETRTFECSSLVPSTSDVRVVSVLNRTHSPVYTPDRVVNPLTPRINSRRAPDSLLREDAPDGGLKFSPVTPILSVQDALAIIQSDVTHGCEEGDVLPAMCSSFDFSDSLDLLTDTEGFLSSKPAEPLALPEISSDFEPVKARLTFFVKSKTVHEHESKDETKHARVTTKSKKHTFLAETVTKSRSCSSQESKPEHGRKASSKRLLMDKTVELIEDECVKPVSRVFKAVKFQSLPVIDSDVSLEAPNASGQSQSPLVVVQSNFSAVVSHQHLSPVLAPLSLTSNVAEEPGLSPIVPTRTSGSLLSTWTDVSLVAGQHDLGPILLNQSETAPSAIQPTLPVLLDSPDHQSKKRKSDEFSKDNLCETFQIKRSRSFRPETEKNKSVQERRPSSRTSQSLHKVTAATRNSHSTVSTKSMKSLNVAQSQLIFSKPVKKGTVRSSVKTSLKTTKSVAGVAQSQLTFIKPVQTAIPRHPLPFAAKNMFYDERWIEKQERGFTWWINYVLTPDDFKVNTEVSKVSAMSLVMGVENQHKVSVPKAPTKEEMSFKAYTARCRLNRLRRAACCLFTSESMVKAIQRLELEIEAKRLLVRKDRHLWKDIGERQKVLNWLLSYNPLWLRIGLEVIYGELISLESNSDVMGMAMFILNRLLWNPDIAAEYRHPKVPHLYRDGHEEALSRFTLKKLLLLVCFLDKAKESRIIEHDPCLFCMDAEFKSSKDLLLAFSRDFLSGEGILSRHLGFLGLPVSHVQTPLDEFSFAVKKLSVDLRCGIRLVRVMELFTQDWSLSRKLRVPAISRLQKIHNVDVALQVLKARGVDLNDEHGATIDSRDIVDGHREKTLTLLWTIIFAFQVDILLDETQLEEEIGFLRRAWRTRQKLTALQSNHGLVEKTKNESNNILKGSRKMNLLMDWVNAVCIFYDAKVENFTVSFSDGRVLCYLIHHYHPCYLPLSAVSKSTTQTVECGQRGTVGLNSSTSDSESSFDVWPESQNGTSTLMLFKELLEKERKNFQLVNTAVSSLGGVPAMIDPADMSNTIPNEKVVVCYLSFLCARLLDLRKETRAARVIQEAWRKFRLQMELKLYEAKNKAALKIQSAVLRFLQRRRNERKNMAALLIQTSWRGYIGRQKVREMKREQLHILQNSAAATIQAHWRRYSAVKKFQQLKCCTIVIQAYARMKRAFVAYQNVLSAAKTIQKHWKAHQLERAERQKYLTLRRSVVIIQRGFRRWKARALKKMNSAAAVIQAAFRSWQKRKAERKNQAAVKIQSWYRMCKYQKKYVDIQQKMIKIQAWYRGSRTQRLYQKTKWAAVCIQRHYRAYRQCRADRERYLLTQRMTTVIQSFYRGMKARWHVKEIKAATVIQSFWRMKRERRKFLNAKQSAVILQSCLRRWNAWKRYQKMKRSAIVIQNRYRAYVSGKKVQAEYNRIRSAVISLQSAYRKWQDRRKAQMHRSVVKIQAWYRGYSARKKFRMVKEATIKIQSYIKMVQARQHYCSLKKATLQMQTLYRANKLCHLERTEYQRKRDACICLQAAVKGHLQRKRLDTWRKSATKIQSFFRMYKTRSLYLKMCSATVIIQKRFRVYRECVRCRHQFLEFKAATICLQAAYRGYSLRKMIKYQNKSATIIQTAVRAHIHRRRFVEMRQASAVIQRWFRACKERQKIRETYLNMQRAALTLQAAYRGHRVRKQMLKHHRAATVIQAAFRMFVIRKDFLRLKQAAVSVQKRFRAKIAGQNQKRKYQNLRKSVVRLQALWRGQTVRKQMRKWHDAAVAIQSLYRTHVAQSMYRSKKRAALVLQRQYRAYYLGKKQHYQYVQIRKAVIAVQAGFRGMKARRELKEKHRAATTIQAAFKAYSCKKKLASFKKAATFIQQWYRACSVGRHQCQEFIKLKQVAVKLQAVYRGSKVRKDMRNMHQAATVIQANFRMYKARIVYRAMKLAATIIQQHYKACARRNQERKKYLLLKSSAVVIQSAYRGMKTRLQIQKMHRAATVIQATYRKYKQHIVFRRFCWAASVIQQRYKAHKIRNIEVKKYRAKKNAAVVIQSAFRGFKSRRQVMEMHKAATIIQRTFRTYCERRRFLSLKAASVVIQQKYRATVAAKTDRKVYLMHRCAIVALQSAYRGMKDRRTIRKMHQAATVIQAAFRMHRARIPFQAMKLAATLIQKYYRAYVNGKNERQAFIKLRNSAVLIQAAYRGMKERRQLQAKCKAAVVIQAKFRMHLHKSYYKRLQWAAQFVQQRYRANKIRETAMEMLKSKKHAAILIQSAFRGMKSRQCVKDMHKAASIIQSSFKAYRERKRYLSVKLSVLAVQQRYRATVAAKRQKEHYSSLRHATLTIQAAYRGFRTRKEIRQKHLAATVIQAAFRSHRETVKFQAMKMSSLIIQKHYKAYIQGRKDREKYLKLRLAVVTIQAMFRGKRVRQNVAEMQKAASTVQASYRMYRQRMAFKRMRWAASVLQQRFRAHRVRNSEMLRYQSIRKAVVCIQAAFRAQRARKLVKQVGAARKIQSVLKMFLRRRHFLKQKAASVVIQSVYRSYRARVSYTAMRVSAAVIQRWYRSCRVAQKQQAKYHAMKQAALTLQSAYRGMVARKFLKHKRAAVKVQSVLHMVMYRRRFLKLRSATVRLQASFRAYAAMKQFRRYRMATLTIQKHYKAHKAKKAQRSTYLKTLESIRKLQSRVRGYLEYRRFQRIKKSTVTIQAFYRGFVQRLVFLQYKTSATKIQRYYRAHILQKTERAKFLELKKSAIAVQAVIRGYLARQLAMKMRAARAIQAWYKGVLVRRDLLATKKAIATVHRCIQTRQIRNRYLKICQSVRIIQKRWRETLYARKEHHNFLKMKSSSIKIQATWKGYCTRKKLLREKRMKRAAITLQAFCRGWLVRKRIAEEKEVKRRLRFSAAVYHHLCAMKIQRRLRAYLALKSAKQQMHSVISLQRWIRSKLQRKRYLEEREKMIKVQRAVRAWLHRRNEAATVIQQAVKRFLFKRRQQRAQRGIIKFQALWRGFRSRKKSDTSEIVAMRCRFESVNQGVREEDKLWNKTTIAIDYLLKYKHFSYILAALKHLETATRLSSKCCEHLVNSGATLTIFTLIRSCNRSVPCMEVITYAVQVLLNLSKYDKTTDAVYDVDHSIDTLLDLLQIYRDKAGDKVADKGGSIFAKTCFLLVILLQNTQRAVEVRNLPKAVDRICSIYRLTARKHKMDAARTLTRQKMNVSLNGSFFSQVTPHKTKAIPRIAPDWVLRKDNMKEVVDPLQAIQMVADALAIVP